MDGREHSPVTDEALDREIAAALDVQPSPEFLARLRTRVAVERVDDGWRWSPVAAGNPWRVGGLGGWLWAGASLTVVALAIAGLWSSRRSPDPVSRRVAVPAIEAPLPAPGGITRASEPGASAGNPVQTARARDVASRPRVVRQAPDVLFSKDESVALQRLFDALGARQPELSALPDLESSLKAPSAIEEIVLEPLALSPLAGPDAE